MPSTKQTISARAVAVELLAASNRPRKVKELVEAALADPRARKMAGKTLRPPSRPSFTSRRRAGSRWRRSTVRRA
jgi:hypothetical protein